MTSQKVGHISLVGRPNAGKSTLLNALVGQKIAGVSAKPQTTRNKILGICNYNHTQMLFFDTPGMHRLQNAATMNSLMNKEAFSVVNDSDIIIYLIDIKRGMQTLDEDFIQSILLKSQCPVLFCLSKADRVKKHELAVHKKQVQESLADLVGEVNSDSQRALDTEVLCISAKDRKMLVPLLDKVEDMLPDGAWIYPDDDLTDRPQRFIAGELIREKVFRLLGEEIPYQTAVRIDNMSFEPKQVAIMASIIVARNSHKGMVIGKRGAKIKEIGIQSRQELENLLAQKVFLDLQVKVDTGWINDRQLIAEYSSLEYS